MRWHLLWLSFFIFWCLKVGPFAGSLVSVIFSNIQFCTSKMQSQLQGEDSSLEKKNTQAQPTQLFGLIHSQPKQPNKSVCLPLKLLTYNVQILNALAHVQLTQLYHNKTQQFMQVQYRFHVNPKACLYKFAATFGKKRIEGVVQEKEQAKQEYTKALKQGRKAAYGEVTKQSKDVMTLQIGNIAPQQEVKIQVCYMQQLGLSLNTFYKFDLPAKINPGYLNTLPEQSYINSFRNQAQKASGQFYWDFKLKVTSTNKLKTCNSLTHKLIKDQEGSSGEKQMVFTLEKGNLLLTDFSFIYTTEQFQMPTVCFGRTDHSCTAMVSFIPKFCTLDIADAERAAKKGVLAQIDLDSVKGEYIFLLDRSGSMSGQRIEKAKKALIIFLKSLPVDSYFNVISFGTEFTSLFPSSVKNSLQFVNKAIASIRTFSGDMGGTEIQYPIQEILRSQLIKGYPKQVFLLTDGDIFNTETIINIVRKNTKYARVHTIGIGDDASQALIKGCAEKGKGYHTFIKDKENPAQKIIQLLNDSLTPLISELSLTYDQQLVQSIVPNPKSMPFILKGEVVTFFITYPPQLSQPTFAKLRYLDSHNKVPFTATAEILPESYNYPYIDKMAAFRSIAVLEESQELETKLEDHGYFVNIVDQKQKIKELSIKHQVISKLTAFVCVEKELQDNQYHEVAGRGTIKVNICRQQPDQNRSAARGSQGLSVYSQSGAGGNQGYGQAASPIMYALRPAEICFSGSDSNLPSEFVDQCGQSQGLPDDDQICEQKFDNLGKWLQSRECCILQISEEGYHGQQQQHLQAGSQSASDPNRSSPQHVQQSGRSRIVLQSGRSPLGMAANSKLFRKAVSKGLRNQASLVGPVIERSLIEFVVSGQQVNGQWKDVGLISKIFSTDISVEIGKLDYAQAAITYLIAKWLQQHHNTQQYSLIIKKALSWLRKQPNHSQLPQLLDQFYHPS